MWKAIQSHEQQKRCHTVGRVAAKFEATEKFTTIYLRQNINGRALSRYFHLPMPMLVLLEFDVYLNLIRNEFAECTHPANAGEVVVELF